VLPKLLVHLQPQIHVGILLAFLLIPVWYRRPQLPIFAHLYVTRFLIFLPMLWSVFFWIVLGAPGLKAFLQSRARVLWAFALLLLALWAFASQVWAFQRVAYPEVAGSAALQFGVSALFALVVACAAPSPRAIIAALVVGLLINAAIVIGQALNQGSLGLIFLGEFPYAADTVGVSILRSGVLRWVRPYGLLPHPNLAAGALLVGILAASSWLLSSSRWQQIAGILLVALGGWALLLSFSRAAWGGLVVGGLALLLFLRRHLRRVETRIALIVAGGLAVAVGLAFFAAYQPLLAARAGEGEESVELRSVSDRIVFINFALRSITERPILGVGIGNFPWRTSYYLAETTFALRGDNVHFVLLAAAAELGIVGLLLLMVAILAGLIAVVKGLRAPMNEINTLENRAARLAFFAIFVALLAVGVLDHYPWSQLQFQVAWWGSLAAAMPRSPMLPSSLRPRADREPAP
jgi:hypothetical protein